MKVWTSPDAWRGISRWMFVFGWSSIAFSAISHFAGVERDPRIIRTERDASPKLFLHITPETTDVTKAGTLLVSFELENRGEQPIYVCQWPGIAFGGGWEPPEGGTEGFGPGYPSSTPLGRKYFIELKPDEALMGCGMVGVFPTEVGEIHLIGIFRSGQRGEEYHLSGWKGEVISEPVTIHVPREP